MRSYPHRYFQPMQGKKQNRKKDAKTSRSRLPNVGSISCTKTISELKNQTYPMQVLVCSPQKRLPFW